MKRTVIATLALAAATATTWAADIDKTVKQKNGWAAYQTEFDRVVAKVNGTCGSKISASYDKLTYPSSTRTSFADVDLRALARDHKPFHSR